MSSPKSVIPKSNESQASIEPPDIISPAFCRPTLSIIIPLYNRVSFIETAIQSVIGQGCDIELIVIDGGSTDGSWQVVQAYKDRISYSISEPDIGIYDAMNKGIDRTSGEWLYFLGADDALQPGIVTKILPFLTSDNRMVYGDVCFDTGWHFSSMLNRRMIFQNTVHHQGAFYNRALFNTFRYDTSLKILSDYELNFRIYQDRLPTQKVPLIVACCREGGASSWIDLAVNETNSIRAKYIGNSMLNNVLSVMLKLYYIQKQLRASLFKSRRY